MKCEVTVSQHELTGAYQADGQVDKAIKVLEHVVIIQKNVLAEKHPNRLASQHQLAGAYRADGQVGKAVELWDTATRKRLHRLERNLGISTSSSTAKFFDNFDDSKDEENILVLPDDEMPMAQVQHALSYIGLAAPGIRPRWPWQ
jgi:tetratricopeptide (TPR) repeat protein